MLLFASFAGLFSTALFAVLARISFASAALGPLVVSPRRPFRPARVFSRAVPALDDSRSTFLPFPSLGAWSGSRVEGAEKRKATRVPDRPVPHCGCGLREEADAVHARRGAESRTRPVAGNDKSRSTIEEERAGSGAGFPRWRRADSPAGRCRAWARDRFGAGWMDGLGRRACGIPVAGRPPRVARRSAEPAGSWAVSSVTVARSPARAVLPRGTEPTSCRAGAPSRHAKPEPARRPLGKGGSACGPAVGAGGLCESPVEPTGPGRAIGGLALRRPDVERGARLARAGGCRTVPTVGLARSLSEARCGTRTARPDPAVDRYGSAAPTSFVCAHRFVEGSAELRVLRFDRGTASPGSTVRMFAGGAGRLGPMVQTRHGVPRATLRMWPNDPAGETAAPERSSAMRGPPFPPIPGKDGRSGGIGVVKRSGASLRSATSRGERRGEAATVRSEVEDPPNVRPGTAVRRHRLASGWTRDHDGLDRPSCLRCSVGRVRLEGQRTGLGPLGEDPEAVSRPPATIAWCRRRCAEEGAFAPNRGHPGGGRAFSLRGTVCCVQGSASRGRRIGARRGRRGCVRSELGPGRFAGSPVPGRDVAGRRAPGSERPSTSRLRPRRAGAAGRVGCGPISERAWSRKVDVAGHRIHIGESRPDPRVATTMRSGSGSMRKTWIRPRVTSRPVGMEVTMYLPAEL